MHAEQCSHVWDGVDAGLQVIKGLDRSLGLVGIGSRSKISVKAPYAYGDEGRPTDPICLCSVEDREPITSCIS